MRTRVMILTKLLSSMVLIILTSVSLSHGSSTGLSSPEEKVASDVQFEKSKQHGKIADVCEIMACIGKLKDVCAMEIAVMTYFKTADKRDAVEIKKDDVAETEMGVVISMLEKWPVDNTSALGSCLDENEELAYRKYKEGDPGYEAWHWIVLFRRMRRVQLDEKDQSCEFTYGQLFQAAEALVKESKSQLGKETIFMKERVFNIASIDKFFPDPADLPGQYSIDY